MSDEKIKMDEEDLEKVESIQKEFDKLVWRLGKKETQILRTKERLERHREEKSEIEEEMNELQQKYRSVSREMHKKYGSGLFDSETGELIERDQ